MTARLCAPDMFTGWGVRTLSSQMVTYNPMSYHNGSIWPHDNSLIADGLRRYGFGEQAELVARAILEAGMRFGDDRLPELFCGFARDRKFDSPPGEYLVSCSPQAWGAGALFHLLQCLAGVQVDMLEKRVRIDPLETRLYDRLRVEGMSAGEGVIDFTITRRRSGMKVAATRRDRYRGDRLPCYQGSGFDAAREVSAGVLRLRSARWPTTARAVVRAPIARSSRPRSMRQPSSSAT